MYIKLLKGLGFSYLFTFASFTIFSIILHFTNISDSIVPGIILLISILSILTGSAICTKNATSQGWLWGSSVGLSYSLIIYIVSSLTLTGFAVPLSSFYLILGYTIIGAIGGIIGINI
jgi:putative membrane protein (TIGR04086 family)